MAARNLQKKEMCWLAVFLCILVIGGVSVSLGDQTQGVIRNGLETTDVSNGTKVIPAVARTEKGEKLTPGFSYRRASAVLNREVVAGWYGEGHHDRLTASGQRFDMHKNTLAHRTLPLGTRVRLVNPLTGKSACGVVNDRGPYVKGRDVDVSYAMARQLGFVDRGIIKLAMKTM